MDYQSNSDKSKEKPKLADKKIEKVVTGEVIQKPRTIGRKFRDIFFGGDVKSAARYVAADVLLPALRNLVFDTVTEGFRRTIFGESSYRRRPPEYRPRVEYSNYSNPINVTYRSVPSDPRRRPESTYQPHPSRQIRRNSNDIILSSRPEAEGVVEQMIDVIDKYDVVSLADLLEMLDQPSTHVDNKWGWTFLNNVEIRQVREGYLIELPAMEALQ